MIIKNALIHDAIRETPYRGDLVIENGKLVSVGGDAGGAGEILDAAGLHAYPGFVDAHSHIGLDSYGGPTGMTYDYNEMNDILCPQLRGLDSYHPMDAAIPMALAGGVTTVAAGPGSANVLGGTFFAVKLYGRTVDAAMLRPSVAMKCAFGENPKRCYGQGLKKSPMTRMGTAALLRELILKAIRYRDDKKDGKAPAFDMRLEAMQPVIDRQIPLKAHAHRADDILTAVRIAKEFDLRLTLDHCTDGAVIADELAKEGFPAFVGPTLGNKSKAELRNKSFRTAKILHDAGVAVSIITDAPVIPLQYLPLCAGLAASAGLPMDEAWKSITIRPAQALGLDARIGSLEVGKDADLVIWTDDPLRVIGGRSWKTFVNGQLVCEDEA